MRIVAAALLCCVPAFAQSDAGPTHDFDWSPNPEAAQLDGSVLKNIPKRMQEFVNASKTAGVVTLLARNGHIASFETVGYRDVRSRSAMGKDTLFRIASLTKPVTCAAIMVLADEGRLSVIDPVEKFLPEYKGLKLNTCGGRAGFACQSTSPARPINLEDLMTHTSGLPSSVDLSHGERPASLAESVTLGGKLRLLFDPRTKWSYSNIGIDILGRVVEIVSGQPFDRFLQDRIFGPLGMKDTYFGIKESSRQRLASLYKTEGGNLVPVEAEWGTGHTEFPSPAGGLISTAKDLFRFNEMMRQAGRLGSTRVLSRAAVLAMIMSHTGDLEAGWSPGLGHGYGYEVVRNVEGMYRFNSLGSFMKGGAYRTYEWVDPAKGLVGIILMQRADGGSDTADEINSFMQISAAAVLDKP